MTDEHAHLDKLRRDDLPAIPKTFANVLDDWLWRTRGVMSSSHDVGLLLDLLADEGYTVTPVKADGA